MEDKHLKVRTHAAHALKAIPDVVRAYGDQLSAILCGSLRGLRACKQRSIAVDPTQMRYVLLSCSVRDMQVLNIISYLVIYLSLIYLLIYLFTDLFTYVFIIYLFIYICIY